MKKSTIATLNSLTRKAYKAARKMDMAIEESMDAFWLWVFPDKPKIDKPQPKVLSTAYPDGTVITFKNQ